ncbi:helix-turn-helix domain-containing protein [Paludifilum halophilum]|uniref:HTH cro/C1-type domain-containing protein n=1 Tax=Paludifilum halophilum TaxID=1642702 RepID=A0A235B1Z8_9BACL|nr:tetratricopeptide repeat protein [Paludifilum halophilum]OYD06251.1 hypothetical protein CHM34_17475 [Paludifilum halophilum]
MSIPHLHAIGEIIRKVRKEKGFRLEDVADENISPATISNIERGIPHVNPEKVRYLLDKLGLEMSEIPARLAEESKRLKNLEFQLDSAYLLWSLNKGDAALNKVNQINIKDGNPLAARLYFIKGLCFFSKKQWKRAEREYYQAIKIVNEHPFYENSNLEAQCFHELGMTYYYQNDLEKALDFANTGIDAYKENGDLPYLRYGLRSNKAVYLDKLGRINEGMQTIQEVWGSIDPGHESKHVTLLYWLKAEFLRKTGMNDEALKYANQGLEISRRNEYCKFIMDFLMTLGSIYAKLVQWDKAKDCFTIAIETRHQLKDVTALATPYTRLGVIQMNEENWDEAKRLLKEAIKIAGDDLPRLSYALMFMGDFYHKQNQPQEAIYYYERALKKMGSFHPTLKSKLYLRLANLWEDADKDEFKKHFRNMNKVRMLQKEKEMDVFDEIV